MLSATFRAAGGPGGSVGGDSETKLIMNAEIKDEACQILNPIVWHFTCSSALPQKNKTKQPPHLNFLIVKL